MPAPKRPSSNPAPKAKSAPVKNFTTPASTQKSTLAKIEEAKRINSAAVNARATAVRNQAAGKVLPKMYSPTIKDDKNNKNKYKKALTTETVVEYVYITPDFNTSIDSGGNTNIPNASIQIPTKDNVISLNRSNNDAAEITALVFEKLGAVELTKFTRTDTVEGINPYYNIISNLSSIKKEFDPSNLISSQKSDTSLYNAFSIKLDNKIPGDKYLQDRSLDNYIYIDTSGNLIIELINITPDELIEVEIDTNGTIVEVR